MKAFLSVIDSVSNWSGRVLSVVWVLVVILISIEVICRYVFGAPTKWNHELVLFLSGAIYVMGGAFTLYHRKHISIDVVYDRFSPRRKAILDLVTFPFFIAFVSALLWLGAARAWGAVLERETSGSPWDPAIYPILLMIPLGTFLILLQGLAKFIRDFTMAIRGKGAA